MSVAVTLNPLACAVTTIAPELAPAVTVTEARPLPSVVTLPLLTEPPFEAENATGMPARPWPFELTTFTTTGFGNWLPVKTDWPPPDTNWIDAAGTVAVRLNVRTGRLPALA